MIPHRRPRTFLLTVLLSGLTVLSGSGRPSTAQTVTWPLADGNRQLEFHGPAVETVVAGGDPVALPGPPAAQAQNTVEAQDPGEALDVLTERLRPFDRIYVLTTGGREVAGQFSRATGTSLTVLVRHGLAREIPASDVQRVWRRGESLVKRGMLYGAMFGAAILTIPWLADSESDASVADKLVVGPLMGGLAGGFYGAIIGAFMHERHEVYRAGPRTVRVMPVIAPGRGGVVVSMQFGRR